MRNLFLLCVRNFASFYVLNFFFLGYHKFLTLKFHNFFPIFLISSFVAILQEFLNRVSWRLIQELVTSKLTRERGTCAEDVVARSTVWWELVRPAYAQSREPSLRIWYPWTPPSLPHPRWSRNHRSRHRRRRLNWNRNRPHCFRQGNCWNLRPQGTPRPVAAAWRSARVHTWNTINLHVTNVNAISKRTRVQSRMISSDVFRLCLI